MSRLIVLPEMPSSEDITSDGWVESQNTSSDCKNNRLHKFLPNSHN